MISLVSFDRDSELAHWNPGSLELEFYERDKSRPEPVEPAYCGVSGKFKIVGSDLIVIFALDGKLALSVNRNIYYVDNDLRLCHERMPGRRRLSVLRHGIVVEKLEYEKPRNMYIPGDYTQVEEEDFDVGAYLCRVVNSPERQARLLKRWSPGSQSP